MGTEEKSSLAKQCSEFARSLGMREYRDKPGREIEKGAFIVYPTCRGSSAELKIGLVVELRETNSRPWLSCITAEFYIDAWRVQNKGRAVPVWNVCEALIVPASSVPSDVRKLLKDASVHGGYGGAS